MRFSKSWDFEPRSVIVSIIEIAVLEGRVAIFGQVGTPDVNQMFAAFDTQILEFSYQQCLGCQPYLQAPVLPSKMKINLDLEKKKKFFLKNCDFQDFQKIATFKLSGFFFWKCELWFLRFSKIVIFEIFKNC